MSEAQSYITEKPSTLSLSSVCLLQLKTGENCLKRHSPKDVHNAITKGLPGSCLKALEQFVSRGVILLLLDTDAHGYRNLVRRKHLPKHATESVLGFIALWNESCEVLGAEHVNAWFQMSLPALDGLTPSELISTHYGCGLLSETLDAMRSGEFA